MGRNRTHLRLSAAQQALVPRLLRTTQDKRERERLQVALWAGTGRYTLEELAEKVGRARATIQLWLGKFKAGNIRGLLQRDTPPGATSPLSAPRLQAQLRAGLRAGRWRSAEAMAAWLKEEHGIDRARKTLYYWLKKNGWAAPGVRFQPSSGKGERSVVAVVSGGSSKRTSPAASRVIRRAQAPAGRDAVKP